MISGNGMFMVVELVTTMLVKVMVLVIQMLMHIYRMDHFTHTHQNFPSLHDQQINHDNRNKECILVNTAMIQIVVQIHHRV